VKPPTRIAVIGAGPKGTFALERLLAHAGARSSAAMEVSVFDPSGCPGAGPNYDPESPDYLRMNFASEQVDMWSRADPPAPNGGRLSFREWCAAAGRPPDQYAPRAAVGRYLCAGYRQLLRSAPAHVSVVHRQEAVEAVSPQRGRWVVEASSTAEFDEVLLAVGHATESLRSLRSRSGLNGRLVPRVFPVESWLNRDRVPDGSVVAIRGFALTMLDAALALTEGRGGRFHAEAAPLTYRFEPAAKTPQLLPFSRSGRPMLAKTDPAWARERRLDRDADDGRARIRALPDPMHVRGDLIPALAAVASTSLARLGVDESEGALASLLVEASKGTPPPTERTASTELELSIEIAAGREPPDAQWAMGQAWRAVYPELVTRLGRAGLEATDWPAFRALSAQMERVAFGPPVINAAKLLALGRAGVVDLDHADATLAVREGTPVMLAVDGERQADLVIDAVLPGPGAGVDLRQPPIDGLLERGLARIAPGRRGIELCADATCVGEGGRPVRGLAAVGRVSEDWVIGNDSLDRTLHDHADRWARRVVARAEGA
jgi:diaminopimelate decarboxylase